MRNLSFISQPWVRTAAMVVSEIMDRLSPNMAPQATAAMQITTSKPVAWLMDTAKGARAEMVPTEVPMEIDTKQAIRNRPATANWLGRKVRNRYTVLSAPPAAEIAPEKAPAARNTKHMVKMFSSATPVAITFSLALKSSFRFWKQATARAMRKITMAGV